MTETKLAPMEAITMTDNEGTKPHLVAVDDVSRTVRRGVYVELVDEFAKSNMKNARVEGVKTTAAVSVKTAVASLGLKKVTVLTVNGEVYLAKK